VSFSQNGMLRSAHGIFAVHGALYALVQALVKSLHGTDPPHAKHTGLLQGQGVRDSKAQICIHDKIYCKCTGVRIMAAVYEACDSVSLGEWRAGHGAAQRRYRSGEIAADDFAGGKCHGRVFICVGMHQSWARIAIGSIQSVGLRDTYWTLMRSSPGSALVMAMVDIAGLRRKRVSSRLACWDGAIFAGINQQCTCWQCRTAALQAKILDHSNRLRWRWAWLKMQSGLRRPSR